MEEVEAGAGSAMVGEVGAAMGGDLEAAKAKAAAKGSAGGNFWRMPGRAVRGEMGEEDELAPVEGKREGIARRGVGAGAAGGEKSAQRLVMAVVMQLAILKMGKQRG